MKRLLLVFLLTTPLFSNAQWGTYNSITFEPGNPLNPLVIIDTVNHHHNIWQVGAPRKTAFTSALSGSNVIVTDTVNPYPFRDTSAFILKMPYTVNASATGGWPIAPAIYMQFSYQLRKDTGSIARLEASTDHGAHWYDVKDTLPYGLSLPAGLPSLSDTTTAWNYYAVSIDMSYSDSNRTDTFMFRFTFISDSAPPARDGWEIDDIGLEYYSEGLPRTQNSSDLTLYPNPGNGTIRLCTQQPEKADIEVYDVCGRAVYTIVKPAATDRLQLPLPSGTYLLKYATDAGVTVRRVVIMK